MRLFFVMFSFLVSAHAAFGSCVNISGTYRLDETVAMRFTQNSCATLRIEFGQIQPNGRINWYKIPIRALLNGSPTCDTFGCVTGRADAQKVELARDKEWLAYSPTHGDCSYNQEHYFFSSQGNLIRSQNVYGCKDGYSGWLEIALVPIK